MSPVSDWGLRVIFLVGVPHTVLCQFFECSARGGKPLLALIALSSKNLRWCECDRFVGYPEYEVTLRIEKPPYFS